VYSAQHAGFRSSSRFHAPAQKLETLTPTHLDFTDSSQVFSMRSTGELIRMYAVLQVGYWSIWVYHHSHQGPAGSCRTSRHPAFLLLHGVWDRFMRWLTCMFSQPRNSVNSYPSCAV
jgi:hypothetical protein